MKHSLRKVFLVTMIMAFFALCFAICSSAASYTITYYQGDTAKLKEVHSDTEEFELRGTQYSGRPNSFPDGYKVQYGTDDKGNALYENVYTMYDGSKQTKKFFGWFTDSGELLAPGEKITLTRDMKVYEAYGFEVNNEHDLRRFFLNGWCYVKMTADINLTVHTFPKDQKEQNTWWKCDYCGFFYDQTKYSNTAPGSTTAGNTGWKCPACGQGGYYDGNGNWQARYYRLEWDGRLEPNWGGCTVGIVDLNGHTITSNGITDYATGNQRTGSIILSSQPGAEFNFTSKNVNDGAFYLTSVHGYGDGSQRLWVGKNVKITSNVPLVRTTNDMSGKVGYPLIELWGDITCPYIVRSQGLSSVDVNIYNTAKLNITSTQYPLLRDTSAYDDIEIMRLNIYGGDFTFPDGFKGFVTDNEDLKECFPVTIEGGTFNMDIAKYISVDYETVNNANGTFSVQPNICPESPNQKHKYLATDITVTCDTDGEIHYKCDFCHETYISHRFALGHNTITMKISDMKNTKKETIAGQYSHTCSRCGSIDYTFFYPDPKEAYITVKVKYERDGVTKTDTLRLKGEDLFGFSTDKDSDAEAETYITTFGAPQIRYTFDDGREEKFKMSDIVAIEIPLGTTKIQGNSAVFQGNTHIQEITLPLSLETVENNAFRDMPQLSNIIGIENISDTIGENAFSQNKDNAHVVLDTLKVNAKTVKSGAFKNVLAKRIIIGSRVKNLGDAFQLDSNIATIESSYDKGKGMLKEVFVEAISKMYPLDDNATFWATERTLAQVYASLSNDEKAKIFTSASTSSALLTKANMYYDHFYYVTVHAPTCIAEGYTAYECKYCELGTKSDFVSNEGITHVWERSPERDVQATCAKEGYTAEYCPLCESVQKLEVLPRNNKHDFTSTELEPDFDACTKTEYHLRRRCGNGCGSWSTNAGKKITVSESQILGHTYSTEEGGIVQIPATCGKPGQTIKTCTRCYEQNTTESPATGVHFWLRDDSKRIAPTCIAPGTNFFNCKNCEATSTESIDQLSYEQAVEKKAHIWVDEIYIKPTKTEYGLKRVYCSLCGQDNLEANTVVPKLKTSAMPWWAYVLIGVGGVAIVGGVGTTIYFAVFKKKNASKSYKYKFNTFKK